MPRILQCHLTNMLKFELLVNDSGTTCFVTVNIYWETSAKSSCTQHNDYIKKRRSKNKSQNTQITRTYATNESNPSLIIYGKFDTDS